MPPELPLAKAEELFREFWAESYPMPPNPHALMTYPSFAVWLFKRLNEQKADD